MSQTLGVVKSRLQELGVSAYVLSKGEVRHLATILVKDEKIEAFIWGVYTAGYACMVATDRRLIFIDKMFFDTKVDEVPFTMIAAVEYDVNVFTSKVRLYTRAKNFTLRRVRHKLAADFATYIEERITQYQDTRDNK